MYNADYQIFNSMLYKIHQILNRDNILNASTLLIVISRYKDTDFLLKNNAFRG